MCSDMYRLAFATRCKPYRYGKDSNSAKWYRTTSHMRGYHAVSVFLAVRNMKISIWTPRPCEQIHDHMREGRDIPALSLAKYLCS